MLQFLEPLLSLEVIKADAETRSGPFGNEPDLSLPGEKEIVSHGKVTLLHSDCDVVWRVHEQIVFTELLQRADELEDASEDPITVTVIVHPKTAAPES